MRFGLASRNHFVYSKTVERNKPTGDKTMTPQEVQNGYTILDEIERAGGQIDELATRSEWGGYSGYAADPDGYRWEIANAGDGPLTALVVPSVPT